MTDEQIFAALKTVDPDAVRLPTGFRLFALAILQAATPTGTTMTIDIINSAADATMSPDEREAFDQFSDDTKQRLLNQILKRVVATHEPDPFPIRLAGESDEALYRREDEWNERQSAKSAYPEAFKDFCRSNGISVTAPWDDDVARRSAAWAVWQFSTKQEHVTSATPNADAVDAKRYRWLRDVSVPPHNFYLSVPEEFKDVKYSKAEVDAEIDKAIAASAPKESIPPTSKA